MFYLQILLKVLNLAGSCKIFYLDQSNVFLCSKIFVLLICSNKILCRQKKYIGTMILFYNSLQVQCTVTQQSVTILSMQIYLLKVYLYIFYEDR